jgi:putative HD superfamily hydrolase of NAD metabolism
MNIHNYKYVNITEITGNIEDDVSNFLLQNNKRKTLKHVVAVAHTNNEIAEKYGLDKNICTISGYLHDISAVIHPNDMLNYIIDNNLFIDEAERKYPFILHQRISKLLAKTFFNIDDETILSAIECHSTLKSSPSQYDMALFIADKLSWDQEGTPPFYDIVSKNLSFSLERACLSYINYIIDNNIILYPHSWIVAGKEYLEDILSTSPSGLS